MPNWPLALVIGAVVLLLALAWLWLLHRPQSETREGLKALGAMSWREFSGAVLASLQLRGFQPPPQDPADALSGPERQLGLLLTHGNERWLLACKHGTAYRIGADTMAELVEAARMRDASGAILATEGQIAPEGKSAAQQFRIELLAGAPLWHALKPHLPAELRQRVEGNARGRVRRLSGIAAVASGALAVVLGAFVLRSTDTASVPATDAARATATQAAESRRHAFQSMPAEDAIETDEAVLQSQREAVSKALMAAPGIIRGFWISKLTLVIDRSGEDAMVWPQVCRELERYPALRTSRVQMNPRAGSADAVRWRQCKTF